MYHWITKHAINDQCRKFVTLYVKNNAAPAIVDLKEERVETIHNPPCYHQEKQDKREGSTNETNVLEGSCIRTRLQQCTWK